MSFTASGVVDLFLTSFGLVKSTSSMRWFIHQRFPNGSRILQTFSPNQRAVMSVTDVAPSSIASTYKFKKLGVGALPSLESKSITYFYDDVDNYTVLIYYSAVRNFFRIK